MAVAALAKIRASTINNIQPKIQAAALSPTQGLTTTITDLAGATVTVTTLTVGATFEVIGVFMFDLTSAATAFAQGYLFLDGVQQSEFVRYSSSLATDFNTCNQTWVNTLATPGSHTFNLAANLSAGTTMQCLGTHTRIIVKITEVVT